MHIKQKPNFTSTRLVSTFALIVMLGVSSISMAAPNIVLLITDDMGWGDVGYNGSEIRTPAIDRLAAEGMRLDRFYAQPACSPTRATLMTGRWPIRHGIYGPTSQMNEVGIAADEKYLPAYLQEAGYQTLLVGKWHLGPNEPQYHPLKHGFDHFYGFLHGFINHYLHSSYGRIDWQRNGETVREEGYSTHLIADEAVRLIRERDPQQPMFLYVSLNAPHTPLQAPKETIAEYAATEDPNRRVYAAMVTEADRAIGAIVNALDEEGLSEDTLVLFFSDNGGAPGAGASNGPLRGGKGSVYEGGIRVPAIAYWPGQIPGSVYEEQITVTDLLPTLASVAGIDLEPPKPIDGRDMWASMRDGESPSTRPRAIFGAPPGTDTLGAELRYAYYKDEWKLARVGDRDGNFQMHLFNIHRDPYEKNDLAEEFPEVLEQLRAEVEALPRVQSTTIDEPQGRDRFAGPGGPASVEPDNRIPDGTPYSEVGPVVHYPGNWWKPREN